MRIWIDFSPEEYEVLRKTMVHYHALWEHKNNPEMKRNISVLTEIARKIREALECAHWERRS